MSEDTERQIGAGVVRRTVVNGMERVEGDEVEGCLFTDELCEIGEVSEIATTPVALALKRREEAVDAVEGLRVGRKIAAVWSEDPMDSSLSMECSYGESMVAVSCQIIED